QGSVPAIVAQQAVTDGNLVVMSRITTFDLPDGTSLVAHDLTTGEMLWETMLPSNFPDSWRSRVTAIRDGHVYATRSGNTNLEYLYALDPADGTVVWESEDLIDEGTTESPAFAESGDLIVGNFFSVMRIDHEDGTTVWQSDRSCPTSNGCEAAVFDDRVYLWQASAAGPKVTAFDLAGGAELYSSEGIGGGFIQQLGLLVGPDGTIYAPRTQNNPITDFFVALEDTGTALQEKWSVPMGYTPFASFAVGPDGSVYSYSPDKEILRLDPDTGEILNTSIPLESDFFQPRMAIDAVGRLFVTNGAFSKGTLFSFDVDLTLRWSETILNVNIGGPALGQGGILIVCGIGTDVRAYQTSSPCEGDANGDGLVDPLDSGFVLARFGCPVGTGDPSCDAADQNGDGVVDPLDVGFVLARFGECP
ncbi:MAG: PQQ-binding-like beta-propeller repeat protein, partial [Planctomycetes bacterium]|nr:PQQ-binding-like beta-propeller repeat protein [Planctomycetota bacterium]